MASNLFLQIFVIGCFVALVVVLFFEKLDYLTYSLVIIIIAGIVTSIFLEETRSIEFYVEAIDWEVIFFLIGMFTIVEVLNEKKIFQELAKRITKKYGNNIRKLFYFLCITSTLVASFLEDLSVALIFGPIIVITCIELKINPTPFLLGMTVCINLASTLLPFGSAENILIVNAFQIKTLWFIQNFGIFFIISTLLTLFLLDKFMLKKYIEEKWDGYCEDEDSGDSINLIHEHKENINPDQSHIFYKESQPEPTSIINVKVEKKTFNLNVVGIAVLIISLIFIRPLFLSCFISMLVFIFINPIKEKDGRKKPAISHYFSKVDYKLIYFFICLFVLVHLMEVNGSLQIIEDAVVGISNENLFVVCIVVILITSILSGFMDNAPVTIIFIPIISLLIGDFDQNISPIIFAFILGINLGGNFLPQGSACDMMTLEIARQNCVYELSYKKLFKVGGAFAVLHILLGIGYLALMIFVFGI